MDFIELGNLISVKKKLEMYTDWFLLIIYNFASMFIKTVFIQIKNSMAIKNQSDMLMNHI